MFRVFTRQVIAPQFETDRAIEGGQAEFLQGNLFEGGQADKADFWRISPDGRASLLRDLQEDRQTPAPDLPTGTKWFDPFMQVRDVAEVVRHARAFAEELTDVTDISFQLEWRGLKSRVISAGARTGRYYEDAYTARNDTRTIVKSFLLAEVIGNLPDVVARLFAPVYRMFDARSDIDAKWVARQMKGFTER